MPKITFIRGEGALGRPLPNKDHVSGLAFPITNANLPAGFSTTARTKKVFSLGEAEALGILTTNANTLELHYQISEFFRLSPSGELWIYLYDDTLTAGTAILEPLIMAPEDGEIRQAAVVTLSAITTAQVQDLQTIVTAMRGVHRPFSCLVSFTEFDTDYSLATLPDLRPLDSEGVSVVIGVDAGGAGAELQADDVNVAHIGATLGVISRSSVHESAAWIGQFNLSNGTELEVLGVGNKTLLYNSISENLVQNMIDKGYIFARKHIGINGSYHSDSSTSTALTSDYAYIENVRVIDKAIRQARTKLLPLLSSPLYVNEDGTLREDTVANFKSKVQSSLDQMAQDGEISAGAAVLDPSQNVLSSSKLVIGQKIVPVGVAREIEVKTEFALSIS